MCKAAPHEAVYSLPILNHLLTIPGHVVQTSVGHVSVFRRCMPSAACHPVQGLKHGAKIVLRGEAGCSDPSVQPGDVVFVLDQKEHRFFKRINQVQPCMESIR